MHITGRIKGLSAIRNFGIAALISAPTWGVLSAGVLSAGILSAAIPAHPGMLNYVEGQASINGQPVTSKQVGTAEVEQGQTIETGSGKAEVLLTPGVFLRVGDNSAVRFNAEGLTNTQVEVLQGKAMVEATDLKENNNIRITDHGSVTTLEKNGLYQFDATQGSVQVYDGKAQVRENDHTVDLKKGKMTETAVLKTEKFDRKDDSDELYRWSDLRSQYLSEASVSSARTYMGSGSGWAGGGWYWNPYYSFYSYLPGDGFLYSPFGYGFFSPFGLRSYYYGGGGYYGGRGVAYHAGDRSGNFGRGATSVRAGTTSFGRSSGAAFTSHASSFGGGGGHAGARR